MTLVQVARTDISRREEGAQVTRDAARAAGEVENALRRLAQIGDQARDDEAKGVRADLHVVLRAPGLVVGPFLVLRIKLPVHAPRAISGERRLIPPGELKHRAKFEGRCHGLLSTGIWLNKPLQTCGLRSRTNSH